jgi:hypothetical protein
MIANTEAASWYDGGRWWMIVAIGLTMAAAVYVIVTTRVLSPAIPTIASIVSFAGQSRRSARAIRIFALVVMCVYAWLGLASVGLLFLPGAVAMGLSVART